VSKLPRYCDTHDLVQHDIKFCGQEIVGNKFIIYHFINFHNRIMSSNCWAWTTHSPIIETPKDKKGIKCIPISSSSHYNLIYKGLGETLNWSLSSLFLFTHCLVYKIKPKIFGSMVITITWKIDLIYMD